MLSFTVIILPRKKRHLWRGQAIACEYEYGLMLCAYTLSNFDCRYTCKLCANILTAWTSKFKLMPEWKLISKSGQWNYMGEVSRLLIASPRPRPMETFFLILFSSLIGIYAPYCLIIIIILFFIIVH